jgi:SOS response regulatory protein OraA/RecX
VGARRDAIAIAAAALARRDLSRDALTRRLEAAGVEADAAREVADRLASHGLVDDLRTARLSVQRLAERGYGDAAIAARLEREGIDGEHSEIVLRELEPEAERALRLARGQRWDDVPRIARLLVRRGFGEEAVDAALSRLDAPGEPELR